MGRALFDTNILIDYISGMEAARDEMERYETRAISVMTWMEVLVGVSPSDEPAVRGLLSRFELVAMTSSIAERTVLLRRERRIKLVDAIILASAAAGSWLLVTRNTRDFAEQAGQIRVPYRI